MSRTLVLYTIALPVIAISGLWASRYYAPSFNNQQNIPQDAQAQSKQNLQNPIVAPTQRYNPLEDYRALFQMGDYENAVRYLRIAHQRNPALSNIQQDLGTALFALGLFRLSQNMRPEAENLFDEAAALGNFDAGRALGGLRLKSGKLEAASDTFEEMYIRTKDKNILQLLIDMALSKDDVGKAENFLNRYADSVTDESEDVKKFLESRRARLDVKKRFVQQEDVVQRNGIQVAFTLPRLKPAAEIVHEAIDQALNSLSKIIGPMPSDTTLRAILIPQADFQNDSGAPPWAGALFDGVIRIPVPQNGIVSRFGVQKLGRLARHETTHAYLYAHCGSEIPAWLGEGIAQHYEGKTPQQSFHSLYALQGQKSAEIEDSFDNPFINSSTNEVQKLYLKSHLLTEVLSIGQNFEAVWRDVFFQSCTTNSPIYQSLRERFGTGSGRELWLNYWIRIKLFNR